jgi:PAS domain S-box-containing protein
VIAISGISRDITEQKQAEQTLHESEERFRTLVEGAVAGVLVTRKTKPVFVNLSHARILGYASPAEFLGMDSVVPLIAPYDQPRLLGYLAARLRGEDAPNRYEYDAVRKDGSIVTLQQLVTVITWDGEPAVLTTAIDVTERKQAEALLRESEQRYRGLMEDTPGFICRFLPDGEITFVNKTYCDYFARTPGQLVGSNFMALIPQTDQEAVMANISALTVEYPAHSHEHQVILPDGTIRWQRWTNRALFDAEDKVISYQAIGEDITERKQAEEEHLKLKKLESLGILAGGIAHDFNNLLTGLFGSVEVAKVFLPADHKSHKYLESAMRSMERATHLTQQLLTFAKGGNPIKETLSVGEVITETAQFSLRGSTAKLATHISPDLWLIEADKGQLSQVISNLVINAQQAMPTGGTVTITAENITTIEGNAVQITVQDEGVGIAPQHLDKIFDPYFSTKQRGSGLGLASTHSIITKHNGRIQVSSRLNQGTTFTIHLPAAKETTTLLPPEPTDESETIPARHTRILILDDEEVVRTVLGAMLEEMGCHVSYAADGQAAIIKYQAAFANGGGYDLVITDLTIPGGMGGQAAAQELLKIHPQAKIVVSSGYATDPVMANFADYGFQAVIAKPYRFTELRKVIQRVLA